ncbi:hypothetical protein KBD75_02400 [Candidatus Woesebacteria bacterium]|nr:hypothetical protein [Candidatus Woesebacteria bacterium]
MTPELDKLAQSYLLGEAALVGISEFAAERSYTEIDQVGYRNALYISHQLTGIDNQREEFVSMLRSLDEAIASDIATTPNPINFLIDKLNALTAQITQSKARSQLP